jgi:hypothetical protein
LTTGQGNRFVLASTTELHEKISELSNRVRELEDGLRASHSQLSSDSHPLLSEELLRIKAPLQREPSGSQASAPKEEDQNPDVVDAFGSLSISISGRTKYFGSTANSWYFLQNELLETDDEENERIASLQNVLPQDILGRSSAFPISPTSLPNFEIENLQLQNLLWYLPTADKAAELRVLYYQHAAWMYDPISLEAFMEQVYCPFYDSNANSPTDDPLLSHRLSLLFMVLAIGSLVDTRIPAYNLEAEKYHQLARAALFRNGLFDEPTNHVVQALFLMSFYLFLADRHGRGSGTRWVIMGMAVKVAQSIGLHRDSGRWKVDLAETQHRRELFWELYTHDSWQCMTFGRPPSFSLAHIDCKMPHAADSSDETSFNAWKHRFSSECLSVMHDQALGAKNPTYTTVLQLDRKLRAFPVPPVLQVAGFGNSEPREGGFPETIMLTMQRHIVLAIRETNLLHLHRSFFARAVSDHPKDPLGSPYGTSVIAAYRSAGSLVALMRNLHSQLQELSERVWFLWTHMFSCAIVLGSIVTRCPSMSLAPSALLQLDSACELFSKAADNFGAQKVLAIMLSLRERAHISLSEHRKGLSSPVGRNGLTSNPVTSVDDDELATLGGKTRLVAKKEPPSPPPITVSPTSFNPVIPLPLSPSNEPRVHPNVVEYLRTFAPTPVPGPSTMAVPQGASQFTDTSMYGMSAMPGNFPTDASMFHQPQHHSHMQPDLALPMDTGGSFPQYFPVYDYGLSGDQNGYPLMQMDTGMNGQMASPVQGRNSLTPETNMQTTWNDFVTGFMAP